MQFILIYGESKSHEYFDKNSIKVPFEITGIVSDSIYIYIMC